MPHWNSFLDRAILPRLQPLLAPVIAPIAEAGLTPHALTFLGLVCGIAAAASIGMGVPLLGLGLFLLNRGLDGLDGALARHDNSATDFGRFFDRLSDLVTYALLALVLGFTIPKAGMIAAYILFALAADILTREESDRRNLPPGENFYFLNRLTGECERGLIFALAIAMPHYFTGFGFLYATLTLINAIGRFGHIIRSESEKTGA